MIPTANQSFKDKRSRNERNESVFSMPLFSMKNMGLSVIKNNNDLNNTTISKDSISKTIYCSDSLYSKQNKKKMTTQIHENSFDNNNSKISQMVGGGQLNYYQIRDKSNYLYLSYPIL